jgi:hypothetical protein
MSASDRRCRVESGTTTVVVLHMEKNGINGECKKVGGALSHCHRSARCDMIDLNKKRGICKGCARCGWWLRHELSFVYSYNDWNP